MPKWHALYVAITTTRMGNVVCNKSLVKFWKRHLKDPPPPRLNHRYLFWCKRELLEADSGGKGAGGGGGRGFDVSKAGDTRVGFVGFPSVGKSTLLTKLTGTHSEAADYEASALYLFISYYFCALFVKRKL